MVYNRGMKLELEAIMKKKGITVAQLSDATGISRQSIYSQLRDPRQIRISSINELCAALECDPNTLFGYDNGNSSGPASPPL